MEISIIAVSVLVPHDQDQCFSPAWQRGRVIAFFQRYEFRMIAGLKQRHADPVSRINDFNSKERL
jgi:hypothetical protein